MVGTQFKNRKDDNRTLFFFNFSGILVMIAVFLHPIGWGAKRVILMCGADAEAFYPAECSIGNLPL